MFGSKTHYQVLIVGGGTAGITVAASLRRRAGGELPIAIVEPADTHYYQPAFTLVGAGAYALSDTRRATASLIPPGVAWIADAVTMLDPDKNAVQLKSGERLTYDYLVLCSGVELRWDLVQGLKDALGHDGVCSNYAPEYAEYTWKCLLSLRRGATGLFTQPPLPFKCPGAPQKIAYLTADYLRRKGFLGECDLRFLTDAPTMFGVPYFAGPLKTIADRYGIKVHFQTNLVAVDGTSRMAFFQTADGRSFSMNYNMLHVTPPQAPHDFVRSSPLANAAGYIDVHQNSLQSVQYTNVFGLGDVCSTPNSKTAAAIRKQAPIVVRNLLHLIHGGSVEGGYDGYASCPLTTAYGKVMMAEFIYGGKVTPTFPLDPSKERRLYWWIKTIGLPAMYWRYMLKGRESFFNHDTKWTAPPVGQ